jgi:hypothetical protein
VAASVGWLADGLVPACGSRTFARRRGHIRRHRTGGGGRWARRARLGPMRIWAVRWGALARVSERTAVDDFSLAPAFVFAAPAAGGRTHAVTFFTGGWDKERSQGGGHWNRESVVGARARAPGERIGARGMLRDGPAQSRCLRTRRRTVVARPFRSV